MRRRGEPSPRALPSQLSQAVAPNHVSVHPPVSQIRTGADASVTTQHPPIVFANKERPTRFFSKPTFRSYKVEPAQPRS